jgi:hypothetical protein
MNSRRLDFQYAPKLLIIVDLVWLNNEILSTDMYMQINLSFKKQPLAH